MFKLIWRNTFRNPLRAALTVMGLAVAVLSFCLLRTVVDAWYCGVAEGSSPVRLITRNAISLMHPLPLAYLPKIKAVPGVVAVSYGNWFAGIYINERNFFPQFAVDPVRQYFEVDPNNEYVIPGEQKEAFFQDRRGCVAGRALAQRFGWNIGDSIILRGTLYPGEWHFILRAIYTVAEPLADEGRFYFHWEYLNETLKKKGDSRADQASWFTVKLAHRELAAQVAGEMDCMFKNSPAETLTETEKAFYLGVVSLTEAILLAIQIASWVIIVVFLVVLANTMGMSARERLGEYAVLKIMGFRAPHLAVLIFGESLLLGLMGGLLGLGLTFPAVAIFPASLGQYFGAFSVTPETMAVGVAAAGAVGVLAAVVPAWQAAKVSIAAALRRVE